MQVQATTPANNRRMEFVGAQDALATSRIVLRRLSTAAEISTVQHLRGEIDLSVHMAAGPEHFQRLEKKETSAVSSSPST